MTMDEVMELLKSYGNEQIKTIYLRHGAKEPLFGVKIEYINKIQKKIKKDHLLAKELYATGNYDAMTLAGKIVDPKRMSKEELITWVDDAYCYPLSEFVVSKGIAESNYAHELAFELINDSREHPASCGYSVLSLLAISKRKEELPLDRLKEILIFISTNIHTQPNRVKYTMNSFVISVGGSIPSLTNDAIEVAKQIGKVNVDMGETSCKVNNALKDIEKIIKRNKEKMDCN